MFLLYTLIMSSNPCINNKEVTSYYLPFRLKRGDGDLLASHRVNEMLVVLHE